MTDNSDLPADTAPAYPSFAEATWVWARIGLLSFGGPAGQIALMHKELVEERRWISENRFLHALNYCMLLPGPEAQQLATYIGWLLHGTRGGVVAGVLFVIPGFLVILTLSAVYAQFHSTALLENLFFGLKAAVLAIVVEAVLRVGRRAVRNNLMLALAALAFLANFAFSVPFPLIVAAAGFFGFFGARRRPEVFASPAHKGATGEPLQPAVLDSHMPHIPATWGRAAKVIVTWGLLWIAPLLVIVPLCGWGSTYTAIWAFFSQMAIVTFGGAYAVLAYLAQQAVEHFGWLRPGEMLDGLALAETTPGPLVLVLTFVGFLATHRDPAGLDPLAAAVLGAGITTWVTFVPCFLWIFLGAPYIEALRANQALSAALSAITAAVVGVVLNLAVWFGLHVLFHQVGRLNLGPLSPPWPVWASFDPAAAGLSLVAAGLLLGLHLGIIRTLVVSAGLGLALSLWLPTT